MRQISRFRLALLASCLSVGLTANVQAQSNTKNTQPTTKNTPPNTKNTQRPSQPAATGGQPAGNGRPAASAGQSKDAPVSKAPPTKTAANELERRPMTAEEARKQEEETARMYMTPELEEILDRWEAESSKIKTLRGEQSRSEFNNVFEVETVSEGPFYLEMPDKGRIDLQAVRFDKKDVSKKKTKDGEPFSLKSGSSQKWICTGTGILILDDDKKTYQHEDIPEDQQGKNIVNSPLPFLFGMKAEEAKRRYILKLVRDSKDSAVIDATPRQDQDKQNYKIARITLQKKNYLPSQVRLLDPAGLDIVYTFDSIKVNERRILPESWGKDPYKPSLRGYTMVVPNSDPTEITPASDRTTGPREQTASREQNGPRGSGVPVRPASQTASRPQNSTSKR